MQNDIKMLLLGPGESGKSTFFKQMKILARVGGYGEAELQRYKQIIFGNCIQQMDILCELARAELQLPKSTEVLIDRVMSYPKGGELWNAEICDTLRTLWEDKQLKELSLRSGNEMNESAKYFFDSLERFRDGDGYNPTKEDVLRARARTSGIEEAEFKVSKKDERKEKLTLFL